MTTPEGKTKAKVRALLSRYTGVYTYWPVPSGFGRTSLDCIGCYRGLFFAIETKAEGKKPTLRQTQELQAMGRAMAMTFVIAGPDDPAIEQLRMWLDALKETVDDHPHISPDQTRRRPLD
jgi:hypothetical protein